MPFCSISGGIYHLYAWRAGCKSTLYRNEGMCSWFPLAHLSGHRGEVLHLDRDGPLTLRISHGVTTECQAASRAFVSVLYGILAEDGFALRAVRDEHCSHLLSGCSIMSISTPFFVQRTNLIFHLCCLRFPDEALSQGCPIQGTYDCLRRFDEMVVCASH